MQLNSLGYKTDLIFTSLDGEVLDRGSYLVVKTLSNPHYFWGNLLIFEKSPRKDDLTTWQEIFDREFVDPRINHRTFAWDEEEIGSVEPFSCEGYRLEKALVLTATQEDVHLPQKNYSEVQIRFAENDSDWEQVLQVQIASASDGLSKEEWEFFYRSQSERFQKLILQGKGHWFCAVLDGRIVGSLGVFTDGEVGRFQIVSVHPDFQRRGICGSLVYNASQYAFEKMNLTKLVMVADEDYHAARVYESVGFKLSEKIYGVCRVGR